MKIKNIPFGQLIYNTATTLSGLQTLGEEYTGIVQVDPTGVNVSSFAVSVSIYVHDASKVLGNILIVMSLALINIVCASMRVRAVSYTHLDVYKRQWLDFTSAYICKLVSLAETIPKIQTASVIMEWELCRLISGTAISKMAPLSMESDQCSERPSASRNAASIKKVDHGGLSFHSPGNC